MAIDGVELWQRAAVQADLSASELGMLHDACSREPELHSRLTLVLDRLSDDVTGTFLRRLVAELVRRGPRVSPRESIEPALNATVVDGEAPLL